MNRISTVAFCIISSDQREICKSHVRKDEVKTHVNVQSDPGFSNIGMLAPSLLDVSASSIV